MTSPLYTQCDIFCNPPRHDLTWAIFVSIGGNMNTQVNINIGRRRRWLNISQAELAKTIKTSQPLLSNIENGKYRVTPRMLERIAAALGVTPVELSGGAE